MDANLNNDHSLLDVNVSLPAPTTLELHDLISCRIPFASACTIYHLFSLVHYFQRVFAYLPLVFIHIEPH